MEIESTVKDYLTTLSSKYTAKVVKKANILVGVVAIATVAYVTFKITDKVIEKIKENSY